jgi:5-methylcytosine-specific restriction endonuclease McrA
MDTLVVNAGYQPMTAVTWQDAFSLFFREKVEIVEEYQDWIVRSAYTEFRVPAVIRLTEYTRPPREMTKFCRENVYARDGWRCQYCGIKPVASKLTFDHVHPKSKGGKTNWTNIITACIKCNHRKADKTLEESGMKLLSQPREPKFESNRASLTKGRTPPPEWSQWLY